MSALLSGLRPAPGAVRLLVIRLVPLALLSAVVFFGVRSGLAGECGYGPCGPEPGVLDLTGLSSLRDGIGSGMGLAAGVAGGFWLLDQWILAGALTVLDPRRGGRVRVLRSLWDARRHVWTFLRIAFVGVVLAGLWALVVNKGTDWLDEVSLRQGWTGTERMGLAVGRAVAIATGIALIGTFTFWCRVLTVLDGRVRVRRTVFHTVRLWWRRPLSGPAASLVLGALLSVLSLPLTTLSAPWSASTIGWVAWAAALLGLFVAWYWRVHVAVQVYVQPELAVLHRRSDEPFGVISWLRALWVRLRR